MWCILRNPGISREKNPRFLLLNSSSTHNTMQWPGSMLRAVLPDTDAIVFSWNLVQSISPEAPAKLLIRKKVFRLMPGFLKMHHLYRNWLEYIRTGSIFVITSRYMGLKRPSSQINELGVVKRLEKEIFGRIKCIGGCVRIYFAIITTGVLVSSFQDPIGTSVSNHPHKRGQKTPMKQTAPTRKL